MHQIATSSTEQVQTLIENFLEYLGLVFFLNYKRPKIKIIFDLDQDYESVIRFNLIEFPNV